MTLTVSEYQTCIKSLDFGNKTQGKKRGPGQVLYKVPGLYTVHLTLVAAKYDIILVVYSCLCTFIR